MLSNGLVLDNDAKSLPAPVSAIDGIKLTPLTEVKVDYKCGHSGWSAFKVLLYGETEIAPHDKLLSKRLKCPHCMLHELLLRTIRCARCGFVIMPGEGVARYAATDHEPEYAKAIEGGVVGCLRFDCCPSGGFIVGHWDGEKVVSAFGGKTAADQVLATGETVIIETR